MFILLPAKSTESLTKRGKIVCVALKPHIMFLCWANKKYPNRYFVWAQVLKEMLDWVGKKFYGYSSYNSQSFPPNTPYIQSLSPNTQIVEVITCRLGSVHDILLRELTQILSQVKWGFNSIICGFSFPGVKSTESGHVVFIAQETKDLFLNQIISHPELMSHSTNHWGGFRVIWTSLQLSRHIIAEVLVRVLGILLRWLALQSGEQGAGSPQVLWRNPAAASSLKSAALCLPLKNSVPGCFVFALCRLQVRGCTWLTLVTASRAQWRTEDRSRVMLVELKCEYCVV